MKPRIRKRGNHWLCGDALACAIGTCPDEAYLYWFNMRMSYL